MGILLAVYGLLLVWLVYMVFTNWWPLTSLRRDDVAEFAATYGFWVTAGNGRYLVGYLVRSMRWRRWGAFVGLIAGFIVAVIRTHTVTTSVSMGAGMTSTSTRSTFAAGWLLLAVVGFFIGALVAEFRGGATATGPRRSAMLVPRRRSAFLDGSVLRPIYAIPVAGVALLGLSFIPHSSLRAEAVTFAACIVAVAITVELTTRWVVSRPNPAMQADLAVAMDAVRVSCLRRIVTIGQALTWGLLAWECGVLSDAVPHHLRGVIRLFVLYAGWSCLRTWVRLRKRSWAVRQPRTAR